MFDLELLIKTAGYPGLFAIVFAESGLLIGFFLPGDSLLFTAGLLASLGFFDIRIITLLTFIGAVAGDSFGYAFGRKMGPGIFKREDSLLFHKDNLERARIFYEHYGPQAIILARFMPVIRTFAPILAGVGSMHYGTFLFYNVVGGFLWAVGLTLLGFFLGKTIPDIDRYLLPIIFLIIFVSVLPPLWHAFKDKKNRERAWYYFRKIVLRQKIEG